MENTVVGGGGGGLVSPEDGPLLDQNGGGIGMVTNECHGKMIQQRATLGGADGWWVTTQIKLQSDCCPVAQMGIWLSGKISCHADLPVLFSN